MAEEGSRRSKIVKLSLFGMIGAVVFLDEVVPAEVEMRRNLYADRAACERDYPPSQCESLDSGGSSSHAYSGSGRYHGPYYAVSRSAATAGDPGPGRTINAHTSVQTSYRGGFGALGHAVRGG